MHIPDGYLGPTTWMSSWAIALAGWTYASKQVKKNVDSRVIPLLSVSAAFTFLIMMFNIPIPGGTTGHAVGAVLVALIIGPWAASLSISVALIIQALIFGDGGITAIGANCLNMAFIMPFTGHIAYRFLCRFTGEDAKGKAIMASIAGWLGLNFAALTTAIMFGIQPILHQSSDGQALYAPYPLSVAVPAMVLEHFFLFGIFEGLVTGLSVYSLLTSKTMGNLGGMTTNEARY